MYESKKSAVNQTIAKINNKLNLTRLQNIYTELNLKK